MYYTKSHNTKSLCLESLILSPDIIVLCKLFHPDSRGSIDREQFVSENVRDVREERRGILGSLPRVRGTEVDNDRGGKNF